MEKEFEKNRKGIASLEIFILIIGTIAFAFMLSEINFVSAEKEDSVAGGYPGVGYGNDNHEDSENHRYKGLIVTVASSMWKNAIIRNFVYATGTNMLIRTILKGEKGKEVANAISPGFFLGRTIASAAKLARGRLGSFLRLEWTGSKLLMAHPAIVWGFVMTGVIWALTHKKTKTKIIEFNCKPWDAPQGGSKCEECNKDEMFPCSEYKCKSLGQGCELIEDKCVWSNEKDIKYPIITTNTEVLPDNLKYSEDDAISPPSRGVKVLDKESSDGCVDTFTPIAFGIKTDEPAKCRIDVERKSFNEMKNSFGTSTLSYNHFIILSLAGQDTDTDNTIEIQQEKTYNFYVKCQDAKGNENPADFIFRICTKSGPDKNVPIILGTSLLNGGYVGYGQTSVDFSLYINEMGTCKWSTQDKPYENMENTMTCQTTPEDEEPDYEMFYRCDTQLTPLKDKQDNTFYFRCKDENNNTNQESFPFTIKGSQPLLIDYVAPNGTIKDSTKEVKVYLEARTSAGADNGNAVCEYSAEKEGEWIPFYYEDNSYYTHYQHKQMLELESGTYTYYIKCHDIGLNYETKKVEFKVESDTSPARIIRIYKEENSLKIITNEEATCVYDIKNCNYNFEDGLEMTTTDNKKHSVIWNTDSTYYIKCRDEYGNEPYPDECSMIIRPTDVVSSL